MPNEVEYRGFTISPDYNLIYMGEYLVYTPVINTLERCKEVIDGLIETMEARGFTCPPKPKPKPVKVVWDTVPGKHLTWDREADERRAINEFSGPNIIDDFPTTVYASNGESVDISLSFHFQESGH